MAAWFWKKKDGDPDERPKKVVIAEGLWVKCDSCKEIVYRAEVERAGRVCPKCGYPFRISARERVALVADDGSFEERETALRSKDPLTFKDTKKYTDPLKAARGQTDPVHAVITRTPRLRGDPGANPGFQFAVPGGSMASVGGGK